MKEKLKNLFYVDGVISKTKVAAVVGLLVNAAGMFGFEVPGLADNMAAFNTMVVIFLGWALRDGMGG